MPQLLECVSRQRCKRVRPRGTAGGEVGGSSQRHRWHKERLHHVPNTRPCRNSLRTVRCEHLARRRWTARAELANALFERSTRFRRRWPGPLIAKMSQWCRSRSRISPQRHGDLDARAPGSEPADRNSRHAIVVVVKPGGTEPRIVISARLAPSPPNSPHPRESLQRNRIRPFRRSPPFMEVCLTARPRAQSITASARTTSRNRRLPFRSFPDRDTARGGRTSPRPEGPSSPRECG